MSKIKPLPKTLLTKIQTQCTPFEQKVYKACYSIPKGETRTYGWIARKIGNPKAARAVGTALANNPFAPEVPCHRVLPVSGKVGNYSGPGGSEGKRRLLSQEGFKFSY